MRFFSFALVGLLAPGLGLAGPHFVDQTEAAGIDFLHRHGGTGEKYMCETMGGGVAFFDMEGDGDLDLLFIQSGPVPGAELEGKGRDAFPNRLYENQGEGRFRDVTQGSGLEGSCYGMGVAVGDADGDGLEDVYVPCFGNDEFFRNRGNGKFEEATEAAGLGNPDWGSSATFADLDLDGDLDLYVANYLDFTMDNNVWCGEHKPGMKAYCHPDAYGPVMDRLYRNRGDGTFEDFTRQAGVDLTDGKGLGVVAGDVDNDGWPDLYVANDSTRNFLLRNSTSEKGELRFEDVTLLSGVGYSETGKTEAGMGVDMGDVDGDGLLDLFVTNLDLEPNELYLNRGDGTFRIATYPSGVGEVSLPWVGFGTGLVDLDNDGDLDILVGNGHIIDNIELYRKNNRHAQPKLLHLNRGDGTFEEVGLESEGPLGRDETTRGVAFGDYDDDGDIDVAVCNNNAGATLLRNDGADGRSLTVVLEGSDGNPTGLGARVEARVGERVMVREARAGHSYQASSDPRVHLGLGSAKRVDELTVVWPGGTRITKKKIPAGRVVIVQPASDPEPDHDEETGGSTDDAESPPSEDESSEPAAATPKSHR